MLSFFTPKTKLNIDIFHTSMSKAPHNVKQSANIRRLCHKYSAANKKFMLAVLKNLP
jgi:hypothetical protein